MKRFLKWLKNSMTERTSIAALALLIAGCASAPPPAVPKPSPPPPERSQVLRDLGFVRTDDGWSLNLAVKPILFQTGADAISDDDRDAIQKVAKGLIEIGVTRVRVEGHTDNVGGASYNQALSERRADAAAREFANAGMNPANIERAGFGFSKPIASNATPEGRARNRRVVIIVPSP